MDRDRPAAAGLVGGHHRVRRVEDFRQPVEQGAGFIRRAGRKPGDDRRARRRIWGVAGIAHQGFVPVVHRQFLT